MYLLITAAVVAFLSVTDKTEIWSHTAWLLASLLDDQQITHSYEYDCIASG